MTYASAYRATIAACCLATLLIAAPLSAQDAADPAPPQGPYRRIAPGIERTVPATIAANETYSWVQKLDELSTLAPELGKRPWARSMVDDYRLEHDVWALEFTYKPVRFVTVEVPTADGTVERKLVWYMVYRVRNPGDKPVRFIPQFVLHAIDSDVYYPDRIIATAMEPIRLREDPNRRLLNTVEISQVEIPPAAEGEDGSVWGVVTWRDIDPSTDQFSVYVKGLTNAYRIKTDDNGRWVGYSRKTLQLNFWRPGDEFFEHEGEIRVGMPGGVDYEWVYW